MCGKSRLAGWGDTLIDYDLCTHQFRIGFALDESTEPFRTPVAAAAIP